MNKQDHFDEQLPGARAPELGVDEAARWAALGDSLGELVDGAGDQRCS